MTIFCYGKPRALTVDLPYNAVMPAEARRLVALLPLQAVVLMIGLRTLARDGAFLQVVGWMLVAGALFAIAGLLAAIRDKARRRHD